MQDVQVAVADTRLGCKNTRMIKHVTLLLLCGGLWLQSAAQCDTAQIFNAGITAPDGTYRTTNQGRISVTSDLFYEVDHHFENRVIIVQPNGSSASYRLTKSKNTIRLDD